MLGNLGSLEDCKLQVLIQKVRRLSRIKKVEEEEVKPGIGELLICYLRQVNRRC